jgi:hypothetical protein
MDSDILLERFDWQELVTLYEASKYAILCLNQHGDNRHNLIVYINWTIIEKYKICTSEFGIAGGCFFVHRDVLIKYPFTELGKYGPDDTIYFKILMEDGQKVGVVKEIYVEHPYDRDIEYDNWKKNQLMLYA